MKRQACDHGPAWTPGGFVAELPRMPRQLFLVAGTVVDRPISNELRERLMLAVARENRCRHCMAAHARLGAASGIPHAEINAILDGTWKGNAPREAAALAYVRDLARREFEGRDEGLWSALDDYFTHPEKDAIQASASVMNFANRFMNGVDALLCRLL